MNKTRQASRGLLHPYNSTKVSFWGTKNLLCCINLPPLWLASLCSISASCMWTQTNFINFYVTCKNMWGELSWPLGAGAALCWAAALKRPKIGAVWFHKRTFLKSNRAFVQEGSQIKEFVSSPCYRKLVNIACQQNRLFVQPQKRKINPAPAYYSHLEVLSIISVCDSEVITYNNCLYF